MVYVLIKGKKNSKGKISVKGLCSYTNSKLDAIYWAFFEEEEPNGNFYIRLEKYRPERLNPEAPEGDAIV